MKRVLIYIFIAAALPAVAKAQESLVAKPDTITLRLPSGMDFDRFIKEMAGNDISTSHIEYRLGAGYFDFVPPPAASYGLYNPYQAQSFGTYRNEWMSVTPIGYHLDNRIEGVDVGGLSARFMATENLFFRAAASVSSSYLGYNSPDRMFNASLALGIEYRPVNWLVVNAYGQTSLNPGLNPMMAASVDAGTYFGLGLRATVNEYISIEGGVQQYHQYGQWATSPYLIFEYSPADWFMIRAFGQMEGPAGMYNAISPGLYGGDTYGAGLRFMFNEYIGVEGGVQRYFRNGKWYTAPYLQPVFEAPVKKKKNPYPTLLPGN